MKKVIWSFAFIVAAIVLLWAYTFGPFTSPGVEFGYYGQFNKVQRIIRAMPELKITDDWQHHDITMEDFGFTVTHRSGPSFRIDFWENSSQMKLSSDADIRHFIDSHVMEQLCLSASSPSQATTKTP